MITFTLARILKIKYPDLMKTLRTSHSKRKHKMCFRELLCGDYDRIWRIVPVSPINQSTLTLVPINHLIKGVILVCHQLISNVCVHPGNGLPLIIDPEMKFEVILINRILLHIDVVNHKCLAVLINNRILSISFNQSQ